MKKLSLLILIGSLASTSLLSCYNPSYNSNSEDSSSNEESTIINSSTITSTDNTSSSIESILPEESSTEIESSSPQDSTSSVETSSPENSSSEIESTSPEESSTELESSSPVDSSTELESSTPEDSSTDIESTSPEEEIPYITSMELVDNEFYASKNDKTLELKVMYSDDTYLFTDVSEDMISGEIDFSQEGTYEIEIKYEDFVSSFEINILGYKTITLNSSDSISGISKYSTGNYVSYTDSNVAFQFYRATRNQSTTLTSIFPKEKYVNADSLNGAVYNKTPIKGIVSLEIEYKSPDGIKLYTGKSKNNMEETILPACLSMGVANIDVDMANFFSIETIANTVVIDSINVNYSNIDTGVKETYENCNNDKYRLNPITYEGTLVPGVSYVDVPIDITVEGESYTVNKTKRYTYYTYNYVVNNPSCKEDAIQVEPMDVANYFIAFKTYPANYVAKKSYSSAYSIFYGNTRCVSDYSRTNGYATSVPYRASSSGTPHYYECDIALSSSYSSSNRGVGRLVVWEYGFNATGYDTSIVAVYTDDHYASFSEYLNNGTWGDRFNAEFNRTAYIYGAAKTLN